MPSSDPTWLLRRVVIDDELVDCRFDAASILDISADIAPQTGDLIVDGGGAAAIPGLVDHHAHLLATAALGGSQQLLPSEEIHQLAERLPPGTGWLRITGAGTRIRRADLDRLWPDRPVRVAHRSGALWMLNTAAVTVLRSGLTQEERATGELWRADRRLRELVDTPVVALDDMRELGEQLARWGITAVSDATPGTDRSALEMFDALPQAVVAMGAEQGNGPVKIVIADSALPAPAELTAAFDGARRRGRAVAVHAVSREALALALGAFADVGVVHGDRLEHVALCDDAAADRIAELSLTVVTQPAIWWRRHAEYLRETSPDDHRDLWRFASLRDRGIRAVASSDAPYGPMNPWLVVHAAASGRPPSADDGAERVSPEVVLSGMLSDPADPGGPRRRLTPGGPAEIVILRGPLDRALQGADRSGESPVSATFLAGSWHRVPDPGD